MPHIVDLTLPVVTGMTGIPGVAFFEEHPVTVRAVTLVSDQQRAALARGSRSSRRGPGNCGGALPISANGLAIIRSAKLASSGANSVFRTGAPEGIRTPRGHRRLEAFYATARSSK
jgi:hypothetical protein